VVSIATFTLPADEFPLGRVFETYPDASLELDRVVPFGDTMMPCFWVFEQDADLAGIRDVFEALPELRSVELLVDLDDGGLFRAEWNPDFLGIMAAIETSRLTALFASGTRDGWRFLLRETEPGQLSAFTQYCADNDIPATLSRLDRVTAAPESPENGLTPEQFEALRLAYEEGYYEDPRRTDLSTLADALGISRQAYAGRLRRAYRAVVADIVARDP